MDKRVPYDLPLSILIHTFNESKCIGATIRSALPLAAEIVVIDAGSSDATVEIARDLGARVFINARNGTAPKRFFGEDQCTHDFVFALGADEILTPQIINEIRTVFAQPQVPQLIIVRKLVVFPGRPKPSSLGYGHKQIRIYDRKFARLALSSNRDKLKLPATGKSHVIGSPLWELTSKDWPEALSRAGSFAVRAAENQPLRSRAYLVPRLVFEFPAAFVKFYIFRRYCLGGRDGLMISLISAYGRFLRIAIMLERTERECATSA